MNADTLLENFEILAEAPGGINQIRELILNLAVRGKLVSRQKTDGVLDSGVEGPFRVPDSWRWERLTSITSDLGQEVPTSAFHYIDVGSINSKAGRVSEEISILKPDEAPSRARKLVKKGTVLYSTVRPYLGNIAIVEEEFDPKSIASTAFAVLHPSDQILSGYLFVCVRSPYFTQFVESKQKGVAYPAINAADLRLAVIPLPPIGEQQEIVSKVAELMALCDQLEQQQKHRNNLRTAARKSAIDAIYTATTPEELEAAWKRINNNWEVFAGTPESVESLRSLILELAVSGKFIQGVGSWDERTLGQVTKIRTGKLDANASSPDGEYPFFTCAKSPLKISTFSYDTECVLLAGNGNFDVNYYSGKFDAYQRTYIIEAKNKDELFIPYLFRFMQGHSKKLLEQSIGGVIKYIKIGFLTDAPLLLPSYSEQKQIVSKVEELMALCDQLEVELKVRSEVAEKFARSVVSAA